MKLRGFLIGAGVLAGSAVQAQALFYGGDFDERNGGLCYRDPGVLDARIYDNFILPTESAVTGIFGNYLEVGPHQSTSAYYEVRSGVSAGNGGTLVTSGIIATSETLIGSFGDLPVDRFSGSIPSMTLQGGVMYWITMAPIGNSAEGRDYLLTTSGANAMGGPVGDGNSYWDSPTYGSNFLPTDAPLALGPGIWDFSIGLQGVPVPEPRYSLAVLLGALALRRAVILRTKASHR